MSCNMINVQISSFLLVLSLSCQYGATQEPYQLSSDELPSDERLLPYIGNGHVATQVYLDTIYINNVFTGNGSRSRRARVPSSVAVRVLVDEPTTYTTYTLDMFEGVFRTYIDAPGFTVEQIMFAHRNRTRVMAAAVTLERKAGTDGDVTVSLELNRGSDSVDLNFTTQPYGNNSWISDGCVFVREYPDSDRPCVYHIYQDVPSELVLNEAEDVRTWSFITSISTDREDAEQEYEAALQDGYASLYQENKQAWHSLWETGSVTMAGNDMLFSTFNAALYYLMSSTLLEQDDINPFGGLSPGSLARGTYPTLPGRSRDYLGHVFWDMDTWMYPGVLMLHPKSAELMLRSRTQVINATRQNAIDYENRGTKFAWEQAYTGYDVCPWPPGSVYQVHVTSDVAFALRQYLYATNDINFLLEQDGKDLALGMARFWDSKVTEMESDGTFGYFNVMGPDEYHYPVNNSVYTNYNALLSLTLPTYIRNVLNVSFTDDENDEIQRFEDVAGGMVILYDPERDYHPQFDGFNPEDTTIKQADVVLLGFPLMMNMTANQRYNDLVIYQNITDQGGPAMTASMHSIAWLELGDETQAATLFETMYNNVIGPFKVFSEVPESYGIGATNFITLSGGFLQSVLFGYGGLRLKKFQLDINPRLLPNTSSWQIHGLDYRGFSIDLGFNETNMEITTRDISSDQQDLVFYQVQDNGLCSRYLLSLDELVELDRGEGLFVTSADELNIDKCVN